MKRIDAYRIAAACMKGIDQLTVMAPITTGAILGPNAASKQDRDAALAIINHDIESERDCSREE